AVRQRDGVAGSQVREQGGQGGAGGGIGAAARGFGLGRCRLGGSGRRLDDGFVGALGEGGKTGDCQGRGTEQPAGGASRKPALAGRWSDRHVAVTKNRCAMMPCECRRKVQISLKICY